MQEAVLPVEAAPRPYNEDLTQIEWELSRVPELAVVRMIEKKLQEMN
jgi:hypothetical protein